jgi:hypothetical protein
MVGDSAGGEGSGCGGRWGSRSKRFSDALRQEGDSDFLAPTCMLYSDLFVLVRLDLIEFG